MNLKRNGIVGVTLLCVSLASVFGMFWMNSQPEWWAYEAGKLVLIPVSFICGITGVGLCVNTVGNWLDAR